MKRWRMVVSALIVAVALSSVAVAQQQPGAPSEPGEAPFEVLEAEAATPAEPAPVTPATPTPTARPGEDANYDLRLRELEDRVNELKEDIFRSKSRLFLLREQILQNRIGGSRAVIRHVNQMSSTFRLMAMDYSLDGNQIYAESDESGELSRQQRLPIYDAAVLPGPHNLAIRMVFEGNGFGLFSYMDGYRFTIQSSHAFNVEEGTTAEIDVVAYERGGMGTPIEERPTISYEVEVYQTTEDALAEEMEAAQ